ncbi:competence protein CoiA [Desulforamulus aquiferis]|nr:competence protein CoiA family protein [Desulforamulus aquiferis]
MLTALLNGNKILATDLAWENRKEELREMCNNQALCPICFEPVICKFGHVKIHHFAHSNRANCPGNQETEEHMKGKALLFSFLQSRFKDKAEVEIEALLPGLSSPCDILIKYPDGRCWAVEFYCGHIKVATLREKLDYYRQKKIDDLWLVSGERYKIIPSENRLKVKSIDRNLIKDTGIDRFYANKWYQNIVENKIVFELPKNGTTKGSINYFFTSENKIVMARALKETDHVTVYLPGDLLEGKIEEVCISEKRNVWFFEQEKDWKDKYAEAERVLAELKATREKQKGQNKVFVESRIRQGSKPNQHQPWLPRERYPKPHVSPIIGLSEKKVQNYPPMGAGKYCCTNCGGEFYERDMVTYYKLSKEGICRECMKRRG